MISTALFYLLVAVVFLAMMSVLVVAHELGHFLAARMLGMGVEEFAVGIGGKPIVTYMRRKYRTPLTDREAEEFAMGGHGADIENVVISYGGKPLFSFWGPLPDQEEKTEYFAPNGSSEGMASRVVRGIEGGIGNVQTGELIMTPEGPALEEETAFTVRPLPLGGFVRIKGMVPEEDGSETKIPGGFYSKPPWQRLVVLFAGPLFSVLAGVLVLIPYFMIVGEQVPSPKPVLGFVGQGLAGDKAGLKAKDQIISVQDVPIYTFYQVIQLVRDRGGLETHMTVLRDGKTLFLTVVPEEDKTPTPVLGPDLKPTGEKKLQGRLGLSPKYDHKPVGFLAATRNAVEIPIESAAGLISAVTHPKDFKDSVGGPETMIRATADATSESFGKVIFLAALLSISVGIFNLLPFPPLDGGQMVMAFAEMLRGGRRLSIRAQSAVILAGLTIVAVMVMCVIVIDFQRFRSTPNSSASSTKPKEATPTK